MNYYLTYSIETPNWMPVQFTENIQIYDKNKCSKPILSPIKKTDGINSRSFFFGHLINSHLTHQFLSEIDILSKYDEAFILQCGKDTLHKLNNIIHILYLGNNTYTLGYKHLILTKNHLNHLHLLHSLIQNTLNRLNKIQYLEKCICKLEKLKT